MGLPRPAKWGCAHIGLGAVSGLNPVDLGTAPLPPRTQALKHALGVLDALGIARGLARFGLCHGTLVLA